MSITKSVNTYKSRSLSEPKVIPAIPSRFLNKSCFLMNYENNNLIAAARRERILERNQSSPKRIISPIRDMTGSALLRNFSKRQNYELQSPFNKNSKVSDRRYLYAKSRICVKKMTDTEAERPFQSEEHTTIFSNGSRKNPKKKSIESTVSLSLTRDNENNSFKADSLNNESNKANKSIKSPDLLDPNWIPLRVQENLLGLHNHLHKRPTLLQNAQISKSDSNLKWKAALIKRPIIESKKILSLQNSEDNATPC
jgi:hypothetical protein